jgi:hypothetical protein
LNGKRNPLYQRARLPEGAQRSTGGVGDEHLGPGYQQDLPALAVRPGSYRPAHPTGEVTLMPTRRDAHELLLIEEADAWFEYLEATRGQTELRYRELEPWAWARLSQRLRAIRTKTQKLKPAAAA